MVISSFSVFSIRLEIVSCFCAFSVDDAVLPPVPVLSNSGAGGNYLSDGKFIKFLSILFFQAAVVIHSSRKHEFNLLLLFENNNMSC